MAISGVDVDDNVIEHLKWIAFSIFVSACFWELSDVYGSLYPKWKAELMEKKAMRYRGFRSSFTASFCTAIIGCLANYAIYLSPSMLEDKKMLNRLEDNKMVEFCVDYAVGYLIYDLINMIRLGTFKEPFYMAHIHHVIVILCCACAMVLPSENYYFSALTIMFSCEANNALGIFHRLLGFCGVNFRTNPLAISVDIIWSISCVFLRLILHPWVTYQIYQSQDRLPQLHFNIAFFGSLGVITLDLILVYLYINSRFKIYADPKPKAA